MPKLKTNSGAAKRFKVTKKGKVKFTRTKRRHLLESKSPKKSRQGRKSAYLHKSDEASIKQILPYA
ncbi:50S ribosomal protein L35 [bacterium]|nr:50S ribosomal protein L35 [bacterium]